MSAPRGNKYAVGNTGGRPPKFKTTKQLEEKIIEYFDYIQGEQKGRRVIRQPEPATVTGLALFLGFASRQSLTDYKGRKEFSDIIKRAVTVIEHEYELRLSEANATGAIFALKNMGWKDRVQKELSGPDGMPIPVESSNTITVLYLPKKGSKNPNERTG